MSLPFTAAVSERLQLRMGEPCQRCGERAWLLTKWQRSNGWAIDIQCQVCGRSGSQPFPKAEHPTWQSYPEFNKSLEKAWSERWMQEHEQGHDQRAAEYSNWLKTSLEWLELRKLVMDRANGRCESCLKNPASQVHHETYKLGWLPPAFDLRAVCKPCHERLHRGWEAGNA